MITIKHDLARYLVSLLLPVLVMVTAAAAQDRPTADRTGTRSSVPAAPVGHRQPTAADVAKARADTADPEREKRERELNKKLQICRGC